MSPLQLYHPRTMSVEPPPRKRAAIADRDAREFLRRADPVLARLIDARPDFRPRAWLDELPPLDAFGTLICRPRSGSRCASRALGQSAILTLAGPRRRAAALRRSGAERLAGANALQANQRAKPRCSARGPLIVSLLARMAAPSSARPK